MRHLALPMALPVLLGLVRCSGSSSSIYTQVSNTTPSLAIERYDTHQTSQDPPSSPAASRTRTARAAPGSAGP
ncbi:uncharacterized protein BO66DRAFT_391800 [Aspergillus aculeatinus CBS 121060]|uniref:Uncharacterized protein n=1 Tax=Aspergillus aculeatinus CBS 121060 TaxID=1448322 RepID=A0ACD1H9M8_9EURO|nr:hypothetical protein BO66DRAFT_391800 [Aspergillus aculeatinus CBS 121060]RAH70283.1 hypothetical protein BO66DRAFT_391800 [Aspergillus aculeatinus CBS 121060]